MTPTPIRAHVLIALNSAHPEICRELEHKQHVFYEDTAYRDSDETYDAVDALRDLVQDLDDPTQSARWRGLILQTLVDAGIYIEILPEEQAATVSAGSGQMYRRFKGRLWGFASWPKDDK